MLCICLAALMAGTTDVAGGADGDYTFDGDTGALTIRTNDGATQWRTDYENRVNNVSPGAIRSLAFGANVTKIPEGAFSGCVNLKTATIGESVTEIGLYAFRFCSALEAIAVPNGVTKIPEGAFMNCVNLKTATIGNTVTEIEQYAFYDCSALEAITVPDSVTTIHYVAFMNCVNLKTVNIGSSVTEIVEGAFAGCSGLETITVDADNTAYVSVDGVLFNNDKTALLLYPGGKKDVTLYKIPNGVTRLGSFGKNGYLQSIALPSDVRNIDPGAFQDCGGLTEVEFVSGSQMTAIPELAFSGCDKLEELILPDSVTAIESSAFPSGLEVLGLPAKLDAECFTEGELGQALADCANLREIRVSEGALHYKSEGGVLFDEDGVVLYLYPRSKDGEAYDIPADTGVIFKNAFTKNRMLKTVRIHADVTEIGDSAFAYCKELTHIDIAEDSRLSKIGAGAFNKDLGAHFLDLYLPRSLKADGIGEFLFVGDISDISEMDPEEILRIPTRLFVYYDSPIRAYCDASGMPYYLRPDATAMQASPPALLYEFIPYQFTPVTKVENNAGLAFWIERDFGDGAGYVPADLPAGLVLWSGTGDYPAAFPEGLPPGTVYGAPLDYAPFVDGVAFRMCAQNFGDVNGAFVATADFKLKLAAHFTTDEDWALHVNAFLFLSTDADPDGKIDDLTGSYADVTDRIMHIGGAYDRFDSFWIDGVKKIPFTHYTAEEGSTLVTVMAKTFQDLDNGPHTAAAAFRRVDEGAGASGGGSDLDVVAQNFTIDLVDSPVPTAPTVPAEPTNPADPTVPTNPTDPAEPTNPTDPAVPASPANATGAASDARSADAAIPAEATEAAEPTEVSDPESATTPADEPGPADGAQAADAAAGNLEAATNVSAPAIPADPENAGGTGELLSGLERGADGEWFFDFDGVTALEARIDKPVEQFEALRFDGEPWTRDADYTVRAGSTIIGISPEKLLGIAAGFHTVGADFSDGETVNIRFNLLRTGAASLSTPEGVPESADGALAQGSGTDAFPARPMLIAGAVLVLVCGALAAIALRRRAART
jgi:hypothetical protein